MAMGLKIALKATKTMGRSQLTALGTGRVTDISPSPSCVASKSDSKPERVAPTPTWNFASSGMLSE